MSGSERIINLLGHYRDRLKRKGDYSEELDYLVGILESPFMREFLEGNMSREDTDHFNEVTSEVISALEEQEEEVHLSPETQRKLVLKRRQSLRALKLAVTPQSSPHITPRTSKISLTTNPLLQHQSSNDSPLLKSVMDTLSSRESSCEPSFSLLSPSPPPTEGATVHDEPSYHDNSVSERKESVASSVSSNTSQLTVLRGGATDEAPPTLPSYSEAFNMCRRTKSYERLPATPPYPAPLMTSGIPTSNTNTSQTRPEGVTMVTVRLTKGDRGLGFSLSSQRRGGKDNKIFIGDLQPGGVAERDGRIMKGDQILHINGQDITSISYSTVVALLQQAKGIVELTLLRSDGAVPSPIRTTPPNPYEAYYRRELYQPAHPMTQPTTTNKVIPSKQSYQQYNQQQQEQGRVHRPSTTDYKHIVSLEVDQDLGFSIISKDGTTFVHVITPGSTTERDGKLMSGDQLLSVNGEEVFGLSHSSVLDILQSCKRFPDQPVKLVVSRQTGPGQVEEAEESFSDIDSSSSDTETVEVQLVKSTSGRGGLGISINALVNDHTEEDKGIYIRAVHPEGPAALSGSVHCKDRIVSVNSQSLRGLSNKEAARLLRTAGDSVRLELRRKKREKERGGGERAEGNVEDNRRTGQLEGTDGIKEEEEEGVVNDSGLRVRSPLSPSVVQWGNILGPDKELITAYIQKTDDSKGLGFGMESIAVVDDTGQTQIGSIRHIIKSIKEGGPMDTASRLRVGDEILQVNGQVLVGMSHDMASDVVREAAGSVKLIVCRTNTGPADTDTIDKESVNDQVSPVPPLSSTSGLPPIEVHQPTTSESEDDHTLPVSLATSPSPVAIHATAGLYQNLNFSRFERQSWRERHNEETRRLKERFELRREHYKRFFQEQADELERVEKENEERRNRIEEEKHKQETGEKKSSLTSGLHYSYYAPISFPSLHESGERVGGDEVGGARDDDESSDGGGSNNRDSLASEESSTSTALSPVPGSAWETTVTFIKLVKGREGLGFSILNFSDESSPGDTVTLVHSLVSGGAAERDGRLQKGDKLVNINGVSVVNQTLQFTVEQLNSVPLDGTVVLGINRRELFSPDFDSTATSNSLSPDHLLDEDRLDDDEEFDRKNGKKHAHTHVRSEPDEVSQFLDLPERRAASATDGIRSATPPDIAKPKTQTQSGMNFLSRTRSDEPARGDMGVSGGGVTGHNLRHVESTSEETLVGSSSHQDLHFSSNQPSPKQQVSPLMKVKPPHQQRDVSSSLKTQLSTSSKASSVTTSVGMGGERGVATIFSPSQSQDSFVESGLSPDTSDTGDHSAESVETEPREVDIKKGTAHLGLTVMEDKGFIVVKKIESGSALAKDGRVRVGDRILAINGKSVEGLSIAKVKSMLKRASSTKSTKVKITYLPVPQGFSMSYSNIITSSAGGGGGGPSETPSAPATAARYISSGQHTGMSHQINIPSHQQQQQQHGGLMSTQSHQAYPWAQQHYNTLPPLHPHHPIQTYMDHVQQGVVKPHPQAPPPVYDMYQSHVNPSRGGHTYHHPLNWNITQGVGGASAGGGGDYSGSGAHPGGGAQGNWRIGQYGGNTGSGNEYHYGPAMPHKYNTIHRTELEHQQMTRLPQLALPPPPMYSTDTYSFPSYSPQRYEGGGDYDHNPGRGHWSHEPTGVMYGARMGGAYIDPTQPRLVEVKRNASGSLGISLGSIEEGGVVINDISAGCQSMTKGQLVVGDKILEVNGIDLRNVSQSDAISIIMNCPNPVHLLVQTYTPPPQPHPPPLHSIIPSAGTANNGTGMRVHTSPLHSNDGSWAIDEEEDEELRQSYPYAQGHLYQVTLNRGQGGLGLSILKTSQSPNTGVSIMQIQPGSVADRTKKIKRGDELIQVNEHCIKGWSQKDVSDLLSRTSVLVNLVLMRPTPDPRLSHQSSTHSLDGVQYLNKQPSVDLSGLPLVKAVNLERDDELGLGFNVSEADFNGQAGVRVSSIIPRGPADLDGHLQVGDYILSIDGHNVLGTKYERATHLLQQARSRGSVSLIVSSQSQLPSQLQEKFLNRSPQKHKKNMEKKRLRVRSEGVTLRNRITKAQRSTRRRPVSVDCEVKYESSPKSDDNSTADKTQHDIDLLTTATTDQVVVVGQETDIELFKGDQSLGLSLADSWQDGIIISKIQPRSPAALDGRLKVGDRITRIGEISLDNTTLETAQKLLLETPPLLQLTVFRFNSSSSDTSSSPGGSTSTGGSREKSRSRSRENDVDIVDLIKPDHKGLGLMILEDQTDGGVFIKDVLPDEVADLSGRIHPGDKILAINGEDISMAGQDFVSSLLQSCHGRVSLTIQHVVHNTQLYQSTQSPTKKTGAPPLYNPSSPPIRLQRPIDPPPYASSEATPMRLDPAPSSAYQDNSYSPRHHHGVIQQTQYRDVVGQSLPEASLSPAPPPPPPGNSQYGNRDIGREGYQSDHHRTNLRYVKLTRGPKGLGFSVAGGKGSPNGDLPICIRSVIPECTAARDGRIRQGDVILSVNGISFENISHKVAVETLTRFRGDITLKLCSP